LPVTITAYITGWCPDCSRSRRVLQRSGVAFHEIDIEKTPGAEAEMRALNGGSGKVPTILIESPAGQAILIEPNDRELREVLQEHQQVA
jgi:mycoredoxin